MTERNSGAEAFLAQIKAEQDDQARRFEADPEAKAKFEAEQAEWQRRHEEAGAKITGGPSLEDIKASIEATDGARVADVRSTTEEIE